MPHRSQKQNKTAKIKYMRFYNNVRGVENTRGGHARRAKYTYTVFSAKCTVRGSTLRHQTASEMEVHARQSQRTPLRECISIIQ